MPHSTCFYLLGLHFVSAAGTESFRILQQFLNMLLHMASVHEEDSKDVSAAFRQSTLNVLSDCLVDLVER